MIGETYADLLASGRIVGRRVRMKAHPDRTPAWIGLVGTVIDVHDGQVSARYDTAQGLRVLESPWWTLELA